MKKILFAAVLLAASTITFAQNTVIDQFFQKYEGKDGFTTVNISATLFSLIASAAPVDQQEVKDMIGDINSVKVLVYDADSLKAMQYYKEISNQINTSDYKELMTVNSDGADVLFLGKLESETVLNEMLLLCNSGGQFALVSITGKIDMDKISKISDMEMKGLDQIKGDTNKSDK